MTLDKIHSEFSKLFDLFNRHYYNNELTKPVMAVQTNGKNKKAMGWCTCGKVWKDNKEDEFFYEITICSEYLYRDIHDICSTLLHEMVHLYCNEHKIKEVSRNNTYHNKKFKEVAEKHGLMIEYDKSIGWSITSLTEDSMKFIDENVNADNFYLTRKNHRNNSDPTSPKIPVIDAGESTKQSMRKYVCPKCNTIIRATKEVHVICGDCNEIFEKERVHER